MSGKGDNRRLSQISRAEEDLRWALAYGHITFARFSQKYNELKKQGKIIRSGRVVR